DSANIETHFYKDEVEILVVNQDITPKGFLRIIQERKQPDFQVVSYKVFFLIFLSIPILCSNKIL
ncbi:MAG: hypothetical protein ACK5R0_10370, partial [Bacteroidota bacterium]